MTETLLIAIGIFVLSALLALDVHTICEEALERQRREHE